MKVRIKKLHPAAVVPRYATLGSGAFDLSVTEHFGDNVFGTGLAFEIPEGHVMLIFSRSGHGFKHNIRLANSVGVIDSDYRQEVKIKVIRDLGGAPLEINVGDRLAQAIIVPFPRVEFQEVEDLSHSDRGGFGSTG
jgi:dUTP pyrophosphatase